MARCGTPGGMRPQRQGGKHTHGTSREDVRVGGPSIAVIGAGFGGIAAVVALRKSGYRDVVVFEKGDEVGGVWRANTYPGAACDVPSHLYSLSFAPNPNWSRAYASQPEILAYIEECYDRFDVRRKVVAGTTVKSLKHAHELLNPATPPDYFVIELFGANRPVVIAGRDVAAANERVSKTYDIQKLSNLEE